MAELLLVRRWGPRPAGETVEVDDEMARFLTGTGVAVRPGDEGRNRANYRAPGEAGPDPRAGGDPTRLRMTSSPKGPREGNRASRVQGAPRAVGDVSHVAPENLGKEHKGDKGDVILASGKTLREDLEEQQRELDEVDRKRDLGGEKTAKSKDEPEASGESPKGEDQGRELSQPKK